MPRWPLNVLLRLFVTPRVTRGGATPVASAFLPETDGRPIDLTRRIAETARRRRPPRLATRRRLFS